MGLFKRLKFWRRKKSKKSINQVVVETIHEDMAEELAGVERTEEESIEEDVNEAIKAENLALKEVFSSLRFAYGRKEEELNNLRVAYSRKEEELKNIRLEHERKEEEIKEAYQLVKELEKALNEQREKISEVYKLACALTFSVWESLLCCEWNRHGSLSAAHSKNRLATVVIVLHCA